MVLSFRIYVISHILKDRKCFLTKQGKLRRQRGRVIRVLDLRESPGSLGFRSRSAPLELLLFPGSTPRPRL